MRPDWGSYGTPFRATTNHFRISSIPDLTIYQYKIEVLIKNGKQATMFTPKQARELLESPEINHYLGQVKDTFIYDRKSHL